jgi:hypothetical protein
LEVLAFALKPERILLESTFTTLLIVLFSPELEDAILDESESCFPVGSTIW